MSNAAGADGSAAEGGGYFDQYPNHSISLVIPCFNADRTLGAVLDGVRRQSQPVDQLLVVDDGSSDDSAAVCAGREVELVSHGRNRGLATARNSGLAAVSGEIVVFVDSDAVPHPDLVARLCAPLADQRVAAVGGQLLEPAPGSTADRWRALFWRQTQGDRPLSDAPFFIGAACAVRRKTALQLSGFDEQFRTNGEDIDLSLRLRRAGFLVVYEPKAQAYHQRRDTPHSLLRMVYRHSRDQVAARRAHDEPLAPVLVNALRWGPVSLVSSLRRHNSASLALLSTAAYTTALAGCLSGLKHQ